MKKHKYRFARIIISIVIEMIHRRVYDVYYQQSYVIKASDRPIIILYSALFSFIPDFRCYLKFYKPILDKAYRLKKLSIINYIVYQKLRKINVERYSSYIF